MGTKPKPMRVVFVLAVIFCVVASDELKDLSSVDAPAPAVEKKAVAPAKAESNLGESEGWGGALMTSGSFTLMAASSGLEEEGELGEGEGWGGALMTSGSFTMMAASSGLEE